MLWLNFGTVLIYLTSGLTSGYGAKENDTTQENLPASVLDLFSDSSAGAEIPAASLTAIKSTVNDKSTSTAEPETLAEAISLAQTGFNDVTQESFENKFGVAEGVSLSQKNLTQASKGKSSIAARKGVNFEQDLTNHDELEPKNKKFLATVTPSIDNKLSTKLSSIATEGTPTTIENAKAKNKLNDTEKSIKSEVIGNKTVPDVILVPSEVNLSNVKHKPKPTATTGEGDDDQKMPPIPTQKPLLGMPRKIDYIVPIAITVMAVPLLAIGAFVLYKRSRDCWDRRHYRRMDFLIDGMYD